MSLTQPKISVVIPVLNSASTMEKALLSIVNQAYDATEIIVLDAGSTDGTVAIIEKYQDKIAYWHSKPDGSPGLALNVGFMKATGDLIVPLMADDWFEPNIFHKVAAVYARNSNIDIISCGGQFAYFDKTKNKIIVKVRYTSPRKLKINLYNMCYGIPAMSSRYFAKAYMDKLGLLDALDADGKHNFSTDREYMIRAALLGCRNVVIPDLGHTYYIHDQSATFGNNLNNQLKIFKEHMALVVNYLEKYPEARENTGFFKHWYAHQSVRLFAYQLMRREWGAAVKSAKAGLRFTPFRWLYCLVELPVQRVGKVVWWCTQKKFYPVLENK